MPIINPSQIQKYTEFGAAYVAATHNCQEDKAHCRSGPLCGFEIEEVGGNLIVQPGRFMTNGISIDILMEQTLTLPAFATPYLLYAHSSDEVQASAVTLDFTDAAGLSPDYVPIAEKTTNGAWRTLPYISEDFIVANTQGGVRHRTTHVMAGGETSVDVAQPLGIHQQTTDGMAVFKDGLYQQKGTDWTPNGMKGVTIAPAVVGDIWHLFESDDIEWSETITTGGGAVTLAKPYNPGEHDLWIFRGGLGKQRLATHYTETDTTTVNILTAGTYVFIKFKHNFWRELVSLSGATSTQDFSNVFDASRADIAVFHSTGAGAAGLLLNQGAPHDYTETSGESIALTPGGVYTGGLAGDTLEIYRLRTGIPKGIGFLMAEGFATGGGGVGGLTTVEDESIAVAGFPHDTINFTGAGVIATDQGAGVVQVTIPGSTAAGVAAYYRKVLTAPGSQIFIDGDVGSTGSIEYQFNTRSLMVYRNGKLLSLPNLDYTEDAAGDRFTINIPAMVVGEEIVAVAILSAPASLLGITTIEDEDVVVAGGPHSILNFTGTGVVATDAGSGQIDVTISGGGGGLGPIVSGTVLESSVEIVVVGNTQITVRGLGFDSTGSVVDLTAGDSVSITTSSDRDFIEAGNRWYYVYLIADSTAINPTRGFLSDSSTSPTLPAGYDIGIRAGAIRNGSSSHLLRSIQRGTKVLFYDELVAGERDAYQGTLPIGNFSGGSPVNFSNFIPPTSDRPVLYVEFNSGGQGQAELFYKSGSVTSGAGGGKIFYGAQTANTGTAVASSTMEIDTLSRIASFRDGQASSSVQLLKVRGWVDSL